MVLNVCFFAGYPSRSYRAAYRRFMSAPTRNAPPVPMDSICVMVRATIDGRNFAERLPVSSTQFREMTLPRRIEMGDHDILTHDSGIIDLKAGKSCRVELTLVPNDDQLKANGLVFHDGRTLEFHGRSQKSYAFGLSLFNDEIMD